MGNTVYKKGDYNIIDDRTGFKIKASKAQVEWTGFFVSSKHMDYRNPQDYIRGRNDVQKVPIPRPEQPDKFTEDE